MKNKQQSAQPSRTLRKLLKMTKDHHPFCGCTPCVALSGWDENDEKKAKAEDRRKKK